MRYRSNVKRLWLIALLAACSGKGDPVKTNPVKSITVTVTAGPLVVGASAQATAVLRDATGAIVTDQQPVWSSVTPAIARVDASGMITALAIGTATVRATSGTVSGDGSITVVNPKALSIVVSRDTASVFLPGGTLQLIATARDSAGAVIANPAITWLSSAPLVASVNTLGLVTGLALGTTTVHASIDGHDASVIVTVRASPNANAPAITAIAPSSVLRPGGSYTLTGTNFAATIGGNAVLVDGAVATVTAASATQLTITVPTSFSCDPTRAVIVQVTAGGLVGGANATLQVANLRSLQPGQSVIVSNAAEVRCNELAFATGRYAVSIYNATRQSITPTAPLQAFITVRGAVPAGSTAANAAVTVETSRRAARAAVPAQATGAVAPLDDDLRRLRANDAAHAAIVRRTLENFRAAPSALRRAPPATAAQGAPGTQGASAAAKSASTLTTLGAVTQLKVPNLDASNFCQTSVPVGARTAYIGQRAIILEDTATTYNGAPTLAGQIDSYYANFGAEFDNVMWPILTGNFGNPLAMDAQLSNTGKIVMLFTPKVNAMLAGTVLGFVVNCDFAPVSQQPSSNVGEYFYAVVPTSPALNYTSPNGRDQWLRLMRATVIHEVKHITSYGERLSRGLPLEEFSWEEGMARNVEELYARSVFYHTTQKADATYAATLACDVRYTTPGPCLDRPLLMLRHFDALYNFAGQTEFVSPLGRGFGGDQTFYASSWSLERWANDFFGASESQFLKDWTVSPSTGVQNFEARTGGQPWEQSMGEWSLALYLDNRAGFTPENPHLRFPSYNLPDLWLGMCSDLGPCTNPNSGNQFYPTSDPWTVRATPFGNFTSQVTLAGGSFSIFDISGTATGRQLLEIRQQAGSDPPPTVRLAIVRIN